MPYRIWMPALLVILATPPAPARAQERLPLSEVLPQLLGNTIVLGPTDLSDQPTHEAHFKPGADQLEVPGQFNRALLTLLSTYPVGSPSGGFTYTFDPALGTFRRTSESFGPSFADRALTIGRGRLSLGFGYQHASYDTFEGLNLRQREVKFYVPHVDCCSRGGGPRRSRTDSRLDAGLRGRSGEAALSLDLSTDTSIVFVTYGVTDRLDLGFAVPFLARQHGRQRSGDRRAAVHRDRAGDPCLHGSGPGQQLFSRLGNASGLGDIVVRGKYRLCRRKEAVSRPQSTCACPPATRRTCSAPAACRRAFTASARSRPAASRRTSMPATRSRARARCQATELRDEINIAAGFDFVLSPRATIAVDFLGRTLIDAGPFEEADKQFSFVAGGTGAAVAVAVAGAAVAAAAGTPAASRTGVVGRPDASCSSNQATCSSTSARRSSASVPWRSLLITAGLLFPLTDTGLRDRVTPVIGIDYEF